jgi:hypothetical protein
MKHDREHRFDPEQHIKEAIERKYGHPATMREGVTDQETDSHWVYMFELSDPSKTEVFAWLKEREGASWFPKVLMVPKDSTITCAAEALRFHAESAS